MEVRRWTLDPDINDSMVGMGGPPPDVLERFIKERGPIEEAAPKVGDQAPDFEAERLSHDGERTGEIERMSDFRGHKVAFLFGSYTCPIYRGQIERFNEIYQELKDKYQFLNIYIREAHPEDGWRLDINSRQGVEYNQPTNSDERASIVKTCMVRNNIDMPMALDNMNDEIEKLYSGSPERLYIIDENGIVSHRSGRGPFDMDMIEAWYDALISQAG